MCGKIDQNVNHLISECNELVQNVNMKLRHDRVAELLYW